ncbi:unnamed protein product [Ixodes pacificus]
MTEVTLSNFDDLLPEIEAAIAGAAFVAVDTEFTGLVREPAAAPSLFDSAGARYQKLRQTVSSYIVCQLGLCTFTSVPSENLYKASAYTIYLCPRSFGSTDPQFSVQASSIEFLCRNGFDFNKCFYEGLPYADRACRRAIDGYVVDADLDDADLQPLYDQVRRWSAADCKDPLKVEPPAGLNPHLVALDLKTRFPNVACTLSREGLVLTPVSAKPQRPSASRDDVIRDSLLGFSRCFETLIRSGKPLVGHNMLLDLLLLLHQFKEPLPRSYARFKTVLGSLFPVVYDTKHISLSVRQQASPWLRELLTAADLFTLHSALANVPVPFAPKIQGAPAVLRAHDAGSDAYVAGAVFIKLAHVLAQQAASALPAPQRALAWPQHRAAVKAFANRINLIRAQCHHVSLEGPDPPAEERPPWLCVRSSRSQVEITAVLARCGIVDVRALSPTRLLVAVGNFSCARDIVAAFQDDPLVSLVRYRRTAHDAGLRAFLWAATLLSLTLSAGCAATLGSSLLKTR